MKSLLSITLAVVAAPSLHAAHIRWMGFDMNTMAAEPFTPLVNERVTTLAPFPEGGGSLLLSSLASAPFEAGPNLTLLSGSSTVANGGNQATTTWNIDESTNTLTMTMNHSIVGGFADGRFAGSEGVFYFFALTPGTVEATWNYGVAETTDPTVPSKIDERGRSNVTYSRNRRGLGADGNYGLTEIVNRDGSRTISAFVDETDDLVGLVFDFRIFEDPMPTEIPDGFLTMTFTPIPEPSTALLGLGALGLFARRRR